MLRKNILTALLMAIGFILRQLIPGLIGGMKGDIMLSVIFVSLLINREFKNALLTGLLGGLITAMTTTFPGGQLPNVIDKLITCMVVYYMIKLLSRFEGNTAVTGAIAFVGTVISGSIFLASALVISGLPAPFTTLFSVVVLPTAGVNIFMTLVVYSTVKTAIKVSGIKMDTPVKV